MLNVRGMGWHRDLPDVRDHHIETPSVAQVVKHLHAGFGVSAPGTPPPSKADLRAYCPPILDQGQLGACTAHAAEGLVGYFEKKTFGRYTDPSRLFVYKASRNLLGWTGDSGAYLRTTMQALAAFGAPPEKYLPYDVAAFDNEPSAFCYALADRFKSLQYYRLDPAGRSPADTLAAVRQSLAAGLPAMYGFTVYNTIPAVGAGTGDIPFPAAGDSVLGGHANLCVGYDDNHGIRGMKGALLTRNSWSAQWGEGGYGWLPYRYVLAGLATDFWSMVRAEYLDIAQFA